MNEFKKEYEYTEEKRGAILGFVIMICSIDIFLALSNTTLVSKSFNGIPGLQFTFLALGILYTCFIFFTAVICYNMKKNMLTVARIYLLVRSVFTIYSAIIIFVHDLIDKSSSGQYTSMAMMIILLLVMPTVYTLAFSFGWNIYFTKSKKCIELKNR